MKDKSIAALEEKLELLHKQIDSLFVVLNQTLVQQATPVGPNGMALATQITGLSKGTIYNLISNRKIPHYKRGKRVYFDREELLKWIKDGKRKTIEELNLCQR